MNLSKRIYTWLLPIIIALSSEAQARDIKIFVAKLPAIAESKDKGILIDYIKAMQKVYKEGKITYEVLPFRRSLEMVIAGHGDIHVPILKDPSKTEKELGFAYSESNIWDVIFALYTNKSNKEISAKNVKNYNVETEGSTVQFFQKESLKSSTCIDCSLKRVNSGKIDGFVFAAKECDDIISKNKLNNIERSVFREFEGKFVLHLGPQKDEVDKILTKIVEKTKETGDYQKTIGQINKYYETWKPTKRNLKAH